MPVDEPMSAQTILRLRGQPPATISKREDDVLRLVADGFTNPMIGKALGISPATVKNHLESIRIKTGIYGRSEQAAWWVKQQSGLLTPQDTVPYTPNQH